MPKYAKKRAGAKSPLTVLAAVVFLTVAYAARLWLPGLEGSAPGEPARAVSGQAVELPEEGAAIWFLDVGQGDSGLIRLADGTDILIDAGTTATQEELSAYLRGLGVDRLDYVIATHPHEDHIGGMARILTDFDIGKFYAPRVADSQTPTTRAYERMLDAALAKTLRMTQGKGGEVVLDQAGNRLELLAPNSSSYPDLNNYSIVAKLTCGERSFLFTGDAEKESETEMIAAGRGLRADVLKCGHHGSHSSTSAAFFQAVSPGAAVISCGAGNDYGHPHRETMDRLQKAGVSIYRTDENGTVAAVCDGSSIVFHTDLDPVA